MKVTRTERVDNPYYKALVKKPCIIAEREFKTEAAANAFINKDIDKYISAHPENDIEAVRVEIPWQTGASLTDKSRFGGLAIYYLKQTW